MSRSSSTPQTQTTTSEPPSYLRPHLEQGLTGASALYGGGGTPVTPFSSQTQTALDLAQRRAMSGSPVANAAQQYAANTLSGGFMGSGPTASNRFSNGYMNPFTSPQANPYAGQVQQMAAGGANPYLDATFNRAANASQNRLASEYARSGRNVDASSGVRAEQLNDLATSIYGGAYDADASRRLSATGMLFSGGEAGLNRQMGAYESDLGRQFSATEGNLGRLYGTYDAERARQQGIVPFAGQLASQDYADIGQLANVGAQYEDLAREQAAQPARTLDEYLARISGMPGQMVTQSTPMERNRLAGALGGAQLGGMMTTSPWGVIGGALGGLLL